MFSLIISLVIFCFIVWGIPLIFLKKNKTHPRCAQGVCKSHIIITTKNTEESIEGIIRSIVWQISNKPDNSFLPTGLFVVDLDSTDDTFIILQKLANEYTFIHPISIADYINYINNIE